MRERFDVPLPPRPPAHIAAQGSLPQEIDMSKNPIKGLMAKARGESLAKQPLVDRAGKQRAGSLAPGSFTAATAPATAPAVAPAAGASGASAPPPPPPLEAPSAAAGSFRFDEKKHVKLAVHSQKPKKPAAAGGPLKK